MVNLMDNRLLKICEKMAEEEKAKKKKKKSILSLPKEKRIQYYSGWHKDDKPVSESKIEKQKKLI
jgi:hypothetical protein